jgi:phosphoenolpyruvate synthase/pyruvate phosphate dikinase
MTEPLYVRWFNNIRLKDLAEVGGKNTSSGELHALLAADGDRVPDGFLLTARAYREALDGTGPGKSCVASSPISTITTLAVTGAKRNHRHVGICGEAPANYPEIARFLAELGIDAISVNAASLLRITTVVYEAEQATAARSLAAE